MPRTKAIAIFNTFNPCLIVVAVDVNWKPLVFGVVNQLLLYTNNIKTLLGCSLELISFIKLY